MDDAYQKINSLTRKRVSACAPAWRWRQQQTAQDNRHRRLQRRVTGNSVARNKATRTARIAGAQHRHGMEIDGANAARASLAGIKRNEISEEEMKCQRMLAKLKKYLSAIIGNNRETNRIESVKTA